MRIQTSSNSFIQQKHKNYIEHKHDIDEKRFKTGFIHQQSNEMLNNAILKKL